MEAKLNELKTVKLLSTISLASSMSNEKDEEVPDKEEEVTNDDSTT
jgi:hypothetical protein